MRGNYLNRAVIVLADALLLALSYVGAYWLRFESIDPYHWSLMKTTIVPIVAVKMVIFSLSGLHAGAWRFTGIVDLVNIIKASILGFFIAMVGMIYFYYPGGFSRSVFVLDFINTIVLIGMFRLSIRIGYSRQLLRGVMRKLFGALLGGGSGGSGRRVIIYGAGERGEMLLRSLTSRQDSGFYHVVGFGDDRPECRGVKIHGVSHLGGSRDMEDLITQYDVDEVMIASDPGKDVVSLIFEICQKHSVSCRVIPPYLDVVHQRLGLSQLKDIEIEDLLRRDTVKIDYSGVSGMIKGRRVLVTGAAGSIGRQLCLQVLEFEPSELICVDMGENPLFYLKQEICDPGDTARCYFYCSSVTNRSRMDRLFARHRPEIIFHAAAHKHVPLMEDNIDEVIMNNVGGTKNVADMADKYGTDTFVFISTDKAVKPENVMGWTKRAGEVYTQRFNGESSTRFLSVRFGNVLGSQGSVVPIFKKQIENGGPVHVTHQDATRYFMTIPEAVLLILQSAYLGEHGDIMILEMGSPVRITDLAELMIRMAGFTPGREVEIEFTGLRPGEKLHEELVSGAEELKKTAHPKIHAVKNRFSNENSVSDIVDDVLIEIHRDPRKGYDMMRERLEEFAPAGNRDKSSPPL